MQHVHFDSFGEPIPQQPVRETASPRALSRLAPAAGICIFWILVVAILSARAFYFDPDSGLKFQHVADVARGMFVTFGII